MASGSTPNLKKPAEDENLLTGAEYEVSKSTDRRYNEVVQEYLKIKLGKTDSTVSNIPPSDVLTLHADQAGPDEGSYVSWECPDTPHSQRLVTSPGLKKFDNIAPIHMQEGTEDKLPSSDPRPFSSVSSKTSALSKETKPRPFESINLGSASSRASNSFYDMDSFQSADPFSPTTKNVVNLSDCSLHSPWSDNPFKSPDEETKQTPRSRKSTGRSRASGSSQRGPSVLPVFPQSVYVPSPDRDMHGSPLTTFSQLDGLPKDSELSPNPFQTPTDIQEKSKDGGDTVASPYTPTIRVTSVKGSSRKVYDGNSPGDPPGQNSSVSNRSSSPIAKEKLLSPTPLSHKAKSKSRHPLGNEEGDSEVSPSEGKLSEKTKESPSETEKIPMTTKIHINDNTPSGASAGSGSQRESKGSDSFYTPHDPSVLPRFLDFENVSERPSEERKKYKTPVSLEMPYPPEETSARTYIINVTTPPRSATSTRSSARHTDIPTWQIMEDMDFYQDQSDYEKTLDCRIRCGWCLIIVGTALLISSVIAILAIEIPAHREEILEALPKSEPLIDYLNEFRGFFLTATTKHPAVSTTTPIPTTDDDPSPSGGRSSSGNKKSSIVQKTKLLPLIGESTVQSESTLAPVKESLTTSETDVASTNNVIGGEIITRSVTQTEGNLLTEGMNLMHTKEPSFEVLTDSIVFLLSTGSSVISTDNPVVSVTDNKGSTVTSGLGGINATFVTSSPIPFNDTPMISSDILAGGLMTSDGTSDDTTSSSNLTVLSYSTSAPITTVIRPNVSSIINDTANPIDDAFPSATVNSTLKAEKITSSFAATTGYVSDTTVNSRNVTSVSTEGIVIAANNLFPNRNSVEPVDTTTSVSKGDTTSPVSDHSTVTPSGTRKPIVSISNNTINAQNIVSVVKEMSGKGNGTERVKTSSSSEVPQAVGTGFSLTPIDKDFYATRPSWLYKFDEHKKPL